MEKPLSTQFWCDRYARGEPDSAANLYGDFLPQFLKSRKVTTVLDYGCGDGHQTRFFLGACPVYVGIDPSPHAIELCRKRIPCRQSGDHTCFFLTVDEFSLEVRWDVTLSLNVLPFLDEKEVRTDYVRRLFTWSHLYVVVFYPVHHRRRPSVLQWIESEFRGWRVNHETDSGFVVYKRVADDVVLIQSIDDHLVNVDTIQLVQYLRLLGLCQQRAMTVWTDNDAIARLIRIVYPSSRVDTPRQPDETVRVQTDIQVVNGEVSLAIQIAPATVYDMVYSNANAIDSIDSIDSWYTKRHRGTVWVLPSRLVNTTWFRKLLRERRVRSNDDLDWFVGRTTSWWTCM